MDYRCVVACTYALDVPKKSKLIDIIRRLSSMFCVPPELIRVCFEGRSLDAYNESLESLKIKPGDTLESYCLTDSPESLIGSAFSTMHTIRPHMSIPEAITALNLKPSYIHFPKRPRGKTHINFFQYDTLLQD